MCAWFLEYDKELSMGGPALQSLPNLYNISQFNYLLSRPYLVSSFFNKKAILLKNQKNLV